MYNQGAEKIEREARFELLSKWHCCQVFKMVPRCEKMLMFCRNCARFRIF